jgi:translation initiation factor 5A
MARRKKFHAPDFPFSTLYLCNAMEINYYRVYDMWLFLGVNEMKEQTEIGKIKEGRYIVIEDEPCRVLGIATSKPGKHGAAKARIDAVGIFDGVKRSIVQPVSAKAYIPIVERKSGQVISIAGNTAQLMDMKDFSNFEIPIPEDKKGHVEVGKEIVYIESMGKRKID